MTDATRFPIDYDSLNKGDMIPASTIEKIVKCERTAKSYQLRVLALKQRVTSDLWDMERQWTLVQRGDDLHVLTDAEAATYTDGRITAELRAMRRTFRHQIAVDVSQLTDEQKAEHDRAIEVNGKTLQAAMSMRRKVLRLTAHQRSTPGLLNQ